MSAAGDRVVVIGAGVAGLTAAAALARAGMDVTVLEARSSVGGCCGTTDVCGYRFNDGAQFIMLPQLVRMVLEHLGIDPGLLALHRARTPLRTELADGTCVLLHPDLRVERLGGSFDQHKAQAEVERCLDRWRPLLTALSGDDWLLGPLRLADVARRLGPHLPRFGRSLQAELEALFSQPAFRAVMAGQLVFAGAPARRFPAASILALVSMLSDGLYLPEGGMGRFPGLLAEAVCHQGGTIAVGTPVVRLRPQATGLIVDASGSDPLSCRAVISTVSPYTTMGRMLPGTTLPWAWRRRLARPRISLKVFSVQLGLRGGVDALSHLNHHLPGASRLDDYFAPSPTKLEWVYASVPSLVAPGLAPPDGSVVELYPAIRQDEAAARWDAARREQFAGQTLAWLNARQPVEIAVQRVRSPLEFEEQLGLVEGGIYGVDPAAGFGALFPQRTPVPGLLLAGQSCFPGFGVPMAAVSGLRAARLAREAC